MLDEIRLGLSEYIKTMYINVFTYIVPWTDNGNLCPRLLKFWTAYKILSLSHYRLNNDRSLLKLNLEITSSDNLDLANEKVFLNFTWKPT